MTIIDINFEGDDSQVNRMLDYLDTKLSPEGMALWMENDLEEWLQARARNRFASEGGDAVGGGGWLPLRPATEAIRASQGFPASHPINKRTGELEDLLTRGSAAIVVTGSGAIFKYPGKVPRGELKTKFQTAQQGRAYPRTPPRPVLGVDEMDLAFILRSLVDWIMNP